MSGLREIFTKVGQFTEFYLYMTVLLTTAGVLVTWDTQYFYLGVWDIEPRAGVVILSLFSGLINLFRTDNKVFFIQFKI